MCNFVCNSVGERGVTHKVTHKGITLQSDSIRPCRTLIDVKTITYTLIKDVTEPCRTLLDPEMVEVARIELASASPLLQGLHAYSVINLTVGYPTGRENSQPVQSFFNVRLP